MLQVASINSVAGYGLFINLSIIHVPAKNYQIKEFFLLLMKYKHVGDVVVESYSYGTCVKGVGGDEQRYNPLVFKKYGAEKSIS